MSEAAQPVEAPAAPAAPPEPVELTLGDALASLEPPGDEPEAPAELEAEPAAAAEADVEPETPAPEAPAAKPADPFKALEALDPEKLTTPAAIAEAVKTVQQAQKSAREIISLAHDKWVKAEKRDAKFEKKLGDFKKERDLLLAYRDEQHALSRQMKAGTAADRWNAFDRWARIHASMSGQDLYTEYSLGLSGKQADPRDALISELKERLDRVEHGSKEKEKAQQAAAGTHAARSAVISGVQDAQRYPALAAAAQEWGVAETCTSIEQGIVLRYGSFGQHVDIDSVLAQAELHLRNERGLVGPGAGEQKPPAGLEPDAGRETSAAVAAKPELARRTPGKSVTPSLASQSVTRTRTREDGETNEELANDPAFFSRLGLNL